MASAPTCRQPGCPRGPFASTHLRDSHEDISHPRDERPFACGACDTNAAAIAAAGLPAPPKQGYFTEDHIERHRRQKHADTPLEAIMVIRSPVGDVEAVVVPGDEPGASIEQPPPAAIAADPVLPVADLVSERENQLRSARTLIEEYWKLQEAQHLHDVEMSELRAALEAAQAKITEQRSLLDHAGQRLAWTHAALDDAAQRLAHAATVAAGDLPQPGALAVEPG